MYSRSKRQQWGWHCCERGVRHCCGGNNVPRGYTTMGQVGQMSRYCVGRCPDLALDFHLPLPSHLQRWRGGGVEGGRRKLSAGSALMNANVWMKAARKGFATLVVKHKRWGTRSLSEVVVSRVFGVQCGSQRKIGNNLSEYTRKSWKEPCLKSLHHWK